MSKKESHEKKEPRPQNPGYCKLCKRQFSQDINTSGHIYQSKHLRLVYKAIAESEGENSAVYENYMKYFHRPERKGKGKGN